MFYFYSLLKTDFYFRIKLEKRCMSGNDIRIQFQTWLSTQEAGCKTLKTRNEYVQRINRICERLYSSRSEKEWDRLLHNMYPVLFIYVLCAKNWNSPEKIKIERSYDYLLNGSFVTLEDKKTLKSKKFREYLRYIWDNKKERFKNHTAIYALCDFVRKTDYASLKTKFNDMITTKIKHLETISTTILSFDFIPATKTKSMRIISRNGCDDLNSFDLVYFFKCSRNTIQNLLKRKALCYSDVDNKLYSIQYINEYLAKKHSEYIKNNNTKLLPKENNNSGKYTNKLLLLYGFYKDFVNGGSKFEKFLINKDENIQTDLIVRNDIISVFKFFKRNKKVLDSLDNDFISLSSFFYNKDFDLPTFNEDWLPKFIRLLQEYSDSVKDDTSDNMQERLFSYLEAIQVYINSAKEQLKEDNWCTLDEAVKNTPLTKKIIQGLRERNKITYTQYSNKVIKYLKSDIESIKEMRK